MDTHTVAFGIFVASVGTATICLCVAGVGIYRFGRAYIKGEESIW